MEELQREIMLRMRGVSVFRVFCTVVCVVIFFLWITSFLMPSEDANMVYGGAVPLEPKEHDHEKHYMTFSPEDLKKFKAMKKTAPSLDLEGQHMLLNGHRLRILSGSIHYFRVVPEYWRDRLEKLKACGFNTVDIYVPWNLHEEVEGQFNFTGSLDVRRFIQISAEVGLYVILRPGPYICAEWEWGGLPSWLLQDPKMKIRTRHVNYQRAFIEFFKRIVPLFNDLQYNQGGNILMVQIENEMGSFGDDTLHMTYIMQTMQVLGVSEVLFISDNNQGLGRILLTGVYMTANFGKKDGAERAFTTLRELQPKAPLFVAELWSGWFDHWKDPEHSIGSVKQYRDTLEYTLREGASVNVYMFHGGTTFGFMNGANQAGADKKNYKPGISSYDYGALLTEEGAITEKYNITKKLFDEIVPKAERLYYRGNKHIPKINPHPPTKNYGAVKMDKMQNFNSLLTHIESVTMESPVSMELLPVNEMNGQAYGLTLYRRTDFSGRQVSLQGGVHDRAQILAGAREILTVDYDSEPSSSLLLTEAPDGPYTLDILVENLGRVNYDPTQRVMNDQRKGLRGKVLDDKGEVVKNWQIFPLDFSPAFIHKVSASDRWTAARAGKQQAPVLYRGTLRIEGEPVDTFVKLEGWKKGIVIVNGRNLGRYWDVGPQKTMYVPKPLLKTGENEVIVFEQHRAPSSLRIMFVDKPELGKLMQEEDDS